MRCGDILILVGISQKKSMRVNKDQNAKHKNTKADKTIKIDKDITANENTAEIRGETESEEELPMQIFTKTFKKIRKTTKEDH